MTVRRICFVCTGNIVRSPLAENLFLDIAGKAGAKYIVSSAGTSDYHAGEPPDERMRRVAARHGLVYAGQARQFQPQDFDRFDLILALDKDNQRNLERLAEVTGHKVCIRLLREFDPLGGSGVSVPDPYYEGMEGFEEVYEIIARSCKGLLEHLEGSQDGAELR
ncbi:MAG: low molecular weight protein-tyrosine-phosphatase [Omnitrophica WOR_2 bacterium]